jgi:CHASE3 domain sensor protein
MDERQLAPISWEERRNVLRLSWGLFIALLIFFIVLASIFFWRVQTLLHHYDDVTQTSPAQLTK